MENRNIVERWKRTEWFRQARFGMFIHWGLYAIPSRGEWVRSTERIRHEDYLRYFAEFRAEAYDPREWAKIAKQAGMKYAVLTAKHHDGFCLFDTALTDFKSTNTPCRRDLVREFVGAFRAEGLKVGFYYSLIDWRHPDFPHYGDRQHPLRDDAGEKNDKRDFSRYLSFMHGQVRELLTNYGKIDIMWFDFSYDDMAGEKWEASKLVKMARKLQPHIIIDNRLEGSGENSGTIRSASPSDFAGDFAAPEQMIPPEGVTNVNGDIVPWESCVTLNRNWGYCSTDTHYKSAKLIIRSLVECVSKNGNLLLNVGPDATGRIPTTSVEILREVGEWMALNGESVYGCGAADLPKPEWGRFTKKGGKLYAHIFDDSICAICLGSIAERVEKLRRLFDGSEVNLNASWNLAEYPNLAFFHLYPGLGVSYPLPDGRDTVIEVTLKADSSGPCAPAAVSAK